jgi:very-short-patch-repair endonuclease
MTDFSKFIEIRSEYAKRLPGWMAEYESTGEMRQDPYFMNWEFTPIEQCVWSDIRTLGVPFFPQIPVLNYFIDFGCPFLKIGIECDGKAWHDHDLDKARDARLAAQGWMIFRIEGHECKRVVEPWEDIAEDESQEEVLRYFLTTSEGVVSAIKRRYFDSFPSDAYRHEIDATLFEHMSTPETHPVRRPIMKSCGPVLIRDCMVDYLQLLLERARGAA